MAARLTIDPNPRRRARDTFPRFEDNVRVLRATYRTLADDVRRGHFVVSAADWLLDNFYLIASEISDIRRNLPRTYVRCRIRVPTSHRKTSTDKIAAQLSETVNDGVSVGGRRQVLSAPFQSTWP